MLCIAPDLTQKYLLKAKHSGDEAYKLCCDERLFNENELNIYSTIPQKKLLTFADINKQITPKNKLDTVLLKSTTNILARIIVRGQTLLPEMKDIMFYNLAT